MTYIDIDEGLTAEDYLRAAEIMSKTRPHNVEYTAQILSEIFPIEFITQLKSESEEVAPEVLQKMVEDDGRTMTEIAKAMRVSRPALSTWLSGRRKPTSENLKRLLEVLEGEK